MDELAGTCRSFLEAGITFNYSTNAMTTDVPFVKDVNLSVQSAVNMFHDLFANLWNLSLFF